MVEKLWVKDFVFSITANFFSFCGYYLLIPTLPLILSASGSNNIQIGYVTGVFALAAVFIRPFSAVFSRQIGVKQLLYLGIIINAVSILAYSEVSTNWALAAIRIIHGIGYGITTTIIPTIAAGIIPAGRRGEGFGLFGAGAVAAGAIFPFGGIWILNHAGPSQVFLIASLTQLLIFACLSSVSLSRLPDQAQPTAKCSFIDVLLKKAVFLPAFLNFLLAICSSSVLSYITLFGCSIGIVNIGMFFFISKMSNIAIRFAARQLFDKGGHSWAIIPGGIIITLGIFIISQATNFSQLWMAAIMYGVGLGMLVPSLMAWMQNGTRQESRGEAIAIFYNASDIGFGIGTIFFGFIASMVSYSRMYLVAVFIMAIFLVIYFINSKSEKK